MMTTRNDSKINRTTDPIGIDVMSFYTSEYFVDLSILAHARNMDVNKVCKDLGQKKMSILPADEDVVTLAANAVAQIAPHCDFSKVSMVIFCTESGIDYSRSSGMYIHDFFQLPMNCRVVELKQACYAATAGLQVAISFLRGGAAANSTRDEQSVLLIASDIAKYDTGGLPEYSQGNGAVAMLIKKNPRLITIEKGSGIATKNTMDFWRPNYSEIAMVDGKLSCTAYLELLEQSWVNYTDVSGRKFNDHDFFCYHTPVPKLVESAFKKHAKICAIDDWGAHWEAQCRPGLIYGESIGNIYTGSLYLGIMSLLENKSDKVDFGGKRIGLYSYGSGSVGEYFSAVVNDGYKNVLLRDLHRNVLESRQKISYDQYTNFYNFDIYKNIDRDGNFDVNQYFSKAVRKDEGQSRSRFKMARIDRHKRIYEK